MVFADLGVIGETESLVRLVVIGDVCDLVKMQDATSADGVR